MSDTAIPEFMVFPFVVLNPVAHFSFPLHYILTLEAQEVHFKSS